MVILLQHKIAYVSYTYCHSVVFSLISEESGASNTEHVQGLGANGKAAFSPKAHG